VVKRPLKYNLIKFLRLKGAPGKIALGFAVGACVNFYPTFGFGIPIAVIAAGIFWANVSAGLLGDIIFKPIFPVFFYLNLATGYYLLPGRGQNIHHVWRSLLNPTLKELTVVGKVFFTGAIINSLIMSVILYLFVYFIMVRYRQPALKWLAGRIRRKHR
jgi:uncharacterized protein (DUF2062 family)